MVSPTMISLRSTLALKMLRINRETRQKQIGIFPVCARLSGRVYYLVGGGGGVTNGKEFALIIKLFKCHSCRVSRDQRPREGREREEGEERCRESRWRGRRQGQKR